MSALRLVRPDESTREMKRATLLDRLAATSIRAGELLPGTQYRIERWLGERAISSTYEAIHVGTQRRCELEILRPEYSERRMAVRALLDEVKEARRAAPNRVVGFDTSVWLPDGRLVLVGPWHGGRTLRSELQGGPIEPSRALGLLRQCCKALAAIHGADLVHRDLSPDSILLVEGAGGRDEIRVRGLGMQRLAGTPVGWALYVAPETLAGIDGRPASDQYALGCVAYEMLTGRPPFVRDDEIEAALAQPRAAPGAADGDRRERASYAGGDDSSLPAQGSGEAVRERRRARGGVVRGSDRRGPAHGLGRPPGSGGRGFPTSDAGAGDAHTPWKRVRSMVGPRRGVGGAGAVDRRCSSLLAERGCVQRHAGTVSRTLTRRARIVAWANGTWHGRRRSLLTGGCLCPDGSPADPRLGCASPEDGGDADAGDEAGDDAGDEGGGSLACDQYAQDCDEGQKCTLYASEDSAFWNSTYCVDVFPNAVPVGEVCHVDGVLTGVDDCVSGALCVNVNTEIGEGVCVATPSSPEALCDAGTAIANEGAITLCLIVCDPLAQNCAPGQGCYPVNESWTCAPDASGEAGAYADPCEFINVCDPGLVCLSASAVPGCAGSSGCCSELCDISDPAGDAQCAGQAGGQSCQPWYEEGTAPPGLEDVGACAIPA